MPSRRSRWKRQLRRYGMSTADYWALFKRQGGKCATCRKRRYPLCVDHCHRTRRVRGLLCHPCNRGLGHFDDDPVVLREAADYLDASRRDPLPAPPRSEPDVGANDPFTPEQQGACMTQMDKPDAAAGEPVSPLDFVDDAPPLSPAMLALPDEPPPPAFAPLDLGELLALDIPERGMVLDPVIPEKGLALLYAARGTGKTHVALGIAHAVATGGPFLKWQAPKARRVLVVDGEMPAADLRDRLRAIVAGAGTAAAPGMLRVLAGDLREDGIGNLARPALQRLLERCLDGAELVILDNLASLLGGHHENDVDAWGTMQRWLLRLRRRGVSVLVVHHAGKSGDQRGISNREDLLDTSISLRRPGDYSPAQGARFEVHVAKGRGLRGRPALPFEATLEDHPDRAIWRWKDLADVERARVELLLAEGMSIRDIAEETGIHRSTVHRIKKKFERDAASDTPEPAQD
jgi:hypothetical protein